MTKKSRKSPLQISDLNCIPERETHSYFQATQTEALMVAGYPKKGGPHFRFYNMCAHDKLEIAASLLNQAIEELHEEETYSV